MIDKIIQWILKLLGLTEEEHREETIYKLKPLMTDYEYKFYDMLKELQNDYAIMPQLNLASVIKKINNNRY